MENKVCVLSQKLSEKIAQNIANKNTNVEVSYENCFDYDVSIRKLINKFNRFIIIGNFATNNELKGTQEFCNENKINLLIVSFNNYEYDNINSKYINHIKLNDDNQEQMFEVINNALNNY